MSRAGVSVFYGAESETTTLAGAKTSGEDGVTLARWKPSRDILYLDLLAAEPIPSIFDSEAGPIAKCCSSWTRSPVTSPNR